MGNYDNVAVIFNLSHLTDR